MDIIKVMIVDDHIIFRKGLRTILNEIDELKVVAEASNGVELMDALKKIQTDVIFMDIRMPMMDGIEATKKVTAKYPDVKIIALTMFEEVSYFNEMIEAGAAGFLLKKTTTKELKTAIDAVLRDDTYFSEEFIASASKYQRIKPKGPDVRLSDRELEVLELICKGNSNAEIAKLLGVSQRTVDGHRAHLFEKTGARNAPNLVLYAVKHGLIRT
ncbi:MAG TPA: response regulator transcription factor [Bacteroidales bacterium]|nr:response regulator transcription factor [Bacteroidales bacterium]HNS47518.1 response regulator transcription factor [Bacteroidales bacterium]